MTLNTCVLPLIFSSLCSCAKTRGVERCLQDNYGMAGDGFSKPYVADVINQLHCDFEYTDLAKIGKMTLNYYPSINDFANHRGFDLVSERHQEYTSEAHINGLTMYPWEQQGHKYESNSYETPGDFPWARERPRMGICRIPQQDGGEYVIQKVGPLVSTGNYDYWQFGWQDVWELQHVLKAHPKGIMFTESFIGAVDENGTVLGHPPIHIHHIHVTPQPGVRYKEDMQACVSGSNHSACAWPNLVIEQHGDYQCMDGEGGTDCIFERTADGHAKVITSPLDLEGESNDVRAPHSAPLRWWKLAVIRWHPLSPDLKPLGQHFFVGPGRIDPKDQRTDVLVFPVLTGTPSMYWYTGMMPKTGVMTRNKLHSHNTMFRHSFWFNAQPRELGLDDSRFHVGNLAWKPLTLDQIGMNTTAIEAYILSRLKTAAAIYDSSCPYGVKSCGRSRPRIVCESWVQNVDVRDPVTGKHFTYDRRAPACCSSWAFQEGEPYTVVAFMAPLSGPVGPWAPDKIPPRANMHIHWLLTYSTPDNMSHYGMTIHNQIAESALTVGLYDSAFDAWQWMYKFNVWQVFKGVCNEKLSGLADWRWYYKTYRFHFYVTAVGFEVFLAMSFLTCCCAFSWKFFKCCKVKRAVDHPIARCAQHAPCPGIEMAVTKAVRYGQVVQHDE
eukprot:TRINITY_DN15358_c0_g1_i2.p1 TRINITY_DN15358_c0_g1~~TRINITY_DN15358_c0_g1_i2.p1  ORF type:complete len:666 (+),score=35.24 TRINITY_DN15358_c0_g1_i2:83-2080(+)